VEIDGAVSKNEMEQRKVFYLILKKCFLKKEKARKNVGEYS